MCLAFGDDVLHGVDHAPVAGAAAQVAAERLAGLQLGGRRVAFQEVVQGHRHARYAEAALHGAAARERPLYVRGLPVLGQALDGADLAAGGGHGRDQAGRDEPPVDLDVARPALALRAAVLGAGQPEPLAQYVQQGLADPRVGDRAVGAVDAQDEGGERVFLLREGGCVLGCGGRVVRCVGGALRCRVVRGLAVGGLRSGVRVRVRHGGERYGDGFGGTVGALCGVRGVLGGPVGLTGPRSGL